ncbi:hypothetical protein JCM1840_006483 [Sporobolomyces johnsonii]
MMTIHTGTHVFMHTPCISLEFVHTLVAHLKKFWPTGLKLAMATSESEMHKVGMKHYEAAVELVKTVGGSLRVFTYAELNAYGCIHDKEILVVDKKGIMYHCVCTCNFTNRGTALSVFYAKSHTEACAVGKSREKIAITRYSLLDPDHWALARENFVVQWCTLLFVSTYFGQRDEQDPEPEKERILAEFNSQYRDQLQARLERDGKCQSPPAALVHNERRLQRAIFASTVTKLLSGDLQAQTLPSLAFRVTKDEVRKETIEVMSELVALKQQLEARPPRTNTATSMKDHARIP